MIKVVIDITLTLQGPILTQSSEPGKLSYDNVIARTPQGQPYLPSSLIVGKLRQAWEELNDALAQAKDNTTIFNPDINGWLGVASATDDYQPNRKQLYFTDFVYQEKTAPANTWFRITIDQERGCVDERQLQMIESPFAAGKAYDFIGQLHCYCQDQAALHHLQRHIEIGLGWTTQLGALRSLGFGRLTKVKLKATETSVTSSTLSNGGVKEVAADNLLEFSLIPSAAFCLAGKPVSDNIFSSEDVISGGVILGAIATTLNLVEGISGGEVQNNEQATNWPELRQYFSRLRCSHAKPVLANESRPLTPPLSLTATSIGAHNTVFVDAARQSVPFLVNGQAPAFALDWKSEQNQIISIVYANYKPQKELRTRTAINPSSLRAKDEQLFTYEQVLPHTTKNQALAWRAYLDLSRIPEPQRVLVQAQLQQVLTGGLSALGKTKVHASVNWHAPTANTVQAVNDKQTRWIVTLQKDTLLGTPEALTELSGLPELTVMYAQAWQALSGNLLRLAKGSDTNFPAANFFARQKILGGRYLYHRTNKSKTTEKAAIYKPWLLTEAGSVFVLEAAGDAQQAASLLQVWQRTGLPLSTSIYEYYQIPQDEDEQWRYCPFLPQQGYGEITVDQNLPSNLPIANAKDITLIKELV